MDEAFEILLKHYDESCPLIEDYDRIKSEQVDVNQQEKNYNSGKKIGYWSVVEKQKSLQFDFYKTDIRSEAEKIKDSVNFDGEYVEENNSPSQFQILSQLYNLLNGDKWYDNSEWKNESTPICEWFGLQCDPFCPDEYYLVS